LKPALDQQEFAVGDDAAVRVIPWQLVGLASVKTPGRQAVSSTHALFFIHELRDYLEALGFYFTIAIVLHRLVATTS
jgi:hypothetical protein